MGEFREGPEIQHKMTMIGQPHGGKVSSKKNRFKFIMGLIEFKIKIKGWRLENYPEGATLVLWGYLLLKVSGSWHISTSLMNSVR